MFKRLIHLQRHGKPVLNPDREAAANPRFFNGTWSPWQVLENDYLVRNANRKIPLPRNKCYHGVNHVNKRKKSKDRSKKSSIPQDKGMENRKTFLDDMLVVFKMRKHVKR